MSEQADHWTVWYCVVQPFYSQPQHLLTIGKLNPFLYYSFAHFWQLLPYCINPICPSESKLSDSHASLANKLCDPWMCSLYFFCGRIMSLHAKIVQFNGILSAVKSMAERFNQHIKLEFNKWRQVNTIIHSRNLVSTSLDHTIVARVRVFDMALDKQAMKFWRQVNLV